ncbi:GGDEF domain-containing protein [Crenobacter sp. SG2305]|uniref:GGDEF domain-containing protein n=1 Tax=Crenobacter oryzisoli TaxID=3056844 RepID=UPI0025AAF7CD|nr:GGDEF domain-containing protein [Crenobacter sp. SG2305]MDN0085242.1 GGDEF domain-containing protein [Crenobacter sp. SG2305]
MQHFEEGHGEHPSNAQTDFELPPFAGAFRHPETERAFLRHHLVHTQTQLRITLGACSCFYVAFALTDVAVLGYSAETLLLLLARCLVALTATAGIYLVARYPRSIIAPTLAATAVEIVGMSTFMLIVLYRPHEIPWHAMSISIMLVVVYLFIPNSLFNATAVALFTTVVFSLLVTHIGALSTSDLLTMTMLLILTNTFGVVAARRYHRLWRDEFRVQTSLQDLSIRDSLTGCYNRRYLQNRFLEGELERARRYQRWLTVIVCDIDHFKVINDNYGHLVGDAVLSHFGELLHSSTRKQIDTVVRYGGEEFLLVLPETDLPGGIHLAERLRTTLAGRPAYSNDGQPVMTTASFGVVAVNFAEVNRPVDQQTLIATADELLYRAKKAGRNRVEFAEMQTKPVVQSGSDRASGRTEDSGTA